MAKYFTIFSDKFAKSNGVTEIAKGCFPYELWHDIKDIRNCTTFPPYDSFRSSLMRPSLAHFEEFVAIVEQKIVLGQISNNRLEKRFILYNIQYTIYFKPFATFDKWPLIIYLVIYLKCLA